MEYTLAFKLRLIYIFRINDNAHKGCLKIGEASCGDVDFADLRPNSKELNQAARKRINQYTRTAGINYELLHTEPAFYITKEGVKGFNDKQVHNVLLRSGVVKKQFANGGDEWFITDLKTACNAIAACRENRTSLLPNEVTVDNDPIIFRPEQDEAIKSTVDYFKRHKRRLWDAKMRFGKTLCALEVVKRYNKPRTLIITHRPVVDTNWEGDFKRIFTDGSCVYSSKRYGEAYSNLAKLAAQNRHFIYFASIPDLRGSKQMGGNFDKNDEIFDMQWDLVIIDEAHEGTQTILGQRVIKSLLGPQTRLLLLTGTAYNLTDQFEEEEIFTWDYISEQRAKEQWSIDYPGDHNPYYDLPRMNIYTFDLGKVMREYIDEDVAFNFHEFFRVNESGEFVHATDVRRFLDIISHPDKDTYYPFSTKAFRDNFRHTLWKVPGVKAAQALSKMLNDHPIFGFYDVVNVAGEGDEEERWDDALKAVKEKIGSDPDLTHTITLTCGRLTTGVTVPAWTAVMMLAGAQNTAASSYMQTIFRVQSPAHINGRVKEECFVFDFAPDRTLKVLADVAQHSQARRTHSGEQGDREAVNEFLKFCPIIAYDGTQMKEYDTPRMLEQLKRVRIERVVNNGFEDGYLYNDSLLSLNDIDINAFKNLKSIIGTTRAMPRGDDIDINRQGFDGQLTSPKTTDKKQKRKQVDEETKARREMRAKAISILRGISIRMPLLIYGAQLPENQDVTIHNFANLIDDLSWKEFMPPKVTKEVFAQFVKYYDEDVFHAAGLRIRSLARSADRLTIEERIERISAIFEHFRNPDKETVLTPWRVVNMHISDCMGGYSFYDKTFTQRLSQPRFVDRGDVTRNVFASDAKILEINSKSGLYPLYMAYSVYRTRLAEVDPEHRFNIQQSHALWRKVVAENIFVICKTPMAKAITVRTLVGFERTQVNTRYFNNLINQITEKSSQFAAKVTKASYWKLTNIKSMKFDAIVGNPPYQQMDGGAGASAVPVYNRFVDIAKILNPNYISMIMPARWFAGGRGLDKFRRDLISDKHIAVLHDFVNARDVFTNVEIKGGICYFLWDNSSESPADIYLHEDFTSPPLHSIRYLQNADDDIYVRDMRLLPIKEKAKGDSFETIVSSMKPYGLRGDVFANPHKYGLPEMSPYNKPDGILIHGLVDLKRTLKRVSPDYPLPITTNLNAYKIFIPRNYGSGKLSENVFTTILAGPGEACTETFIQIGPFAGALERDNCNKYLKTKFLRILVGIRKQDQGAGRDVYRYVPMQDFTEKSDIDWTKSIDEIDQQLYRKYGITEEEIAFINSMIRPMS